MSGIIKTSIYILDKTNITQKFEDGPSIPLRPPELNKNLTLERLSPWHLTRTLTARAQHARAKSNRCTFSRNERDSPAKNPSRRWNKKTRSSAFVCRVIGLSLLLEAAHCHWRCPVIWRTWGRACMKIQPQKSPFPTKQSRASRARASFGEGARSAKSILRKSEGWRKNGDILVGHVLPPAGARSRGAPRDAGALVSFSGKEGNSCLSLPLSLASLA